VTVSRAGRRSASGSGSTLSDVRDAAGPRIAVARTAVVAILLVIVLAGLAGLLGVRSTTRTASSGPWTVSVTYAWVARAGLDVPWTVTVRRAGGFPGPVTLAVTSDYFDIFESQGLDPEPATETADDTNLYWTFDPPPGETLSVDFDAYIQPSSQLGESGEVSVVDAGAPAATVSFSTFLLP
jgi:hypothetical protein